MISFVIFALVRFVLAALAIYFVLTLIRWLIRALTWSTGETQKYPKQGNSSDTKEDYKDVKDAKFVELTTNEADKKQE
jgi:hypothetical protein